MAATQALAELGASIEAFDADGTDRVLARVLWDLPLAESLSEVVIPLLQQLGDKWEQGELTVAHEHFATNLLRHRLSAFLDGEAPDSTAGEGPVALLACPPGEQHDLVLLCFSLLLREAGWRALYLGADTPLPALAGAADRAGADVVVLAATRAAIFVDAAAAVATLATRHRVLIGGRGADEDVAVLLGADLLAQDPVRALAQVRALRPDSGQARGATQR